MKKSLGKIKDSTLTKTSYVNPISLFTVIFFIKRLTKVGLGDPNHNYLNTASIIRLMPVPKPQKVFAKLKAPMVHGILKAQDISFSRLEIGKILLYNGQIVNKHKICSPLFSYQILYKLCKT